MDPVPTPVCLGFMYLIIARQIFISVYLYKSILPSAVRG
jgi:hypothetical protein